MAMPEQKPSPSKRACRGRRPRISQEKEDRKILVRTNGELHKRVLEASSKAGQSMNAWVIDCLEKATAKPAAKATTQRSTSGS